LEAVVLNIFDTKLYKHFPIHPDNASTLPREKINFVIFVASIGVILAILVTGINIFIY